MSRLRFSKFFDEDASALELNLTPLIDIVFLLLIFFMLSTSFIDTSSLPVELPSAEKAAHSEDPKTFEIRIGAAGELEVNGDRVTIEELSTSLKEIEDSTAVLVRADKNTKHGTVVEVMDIAERAGIASIAVAVQASQ